MSSERAAQNFIRDIIDEDLRTGRHTRVVTRFPPEPNGYLHIGHAKAICLNFGLARDYGGVCHLRMDDTNPSTEDLEYVESIQRDIRWLGFDWHDKMFYASDYFEALYDHAVQLIRDGLAYVDSASEDEIRAHRGSLSEPGRPTPSRARATDDNLDLFARMRAGEFADGSHVLRARIDLAAANMKMRDPLLYRIRHAHHYRTGDAWCIYPMYDYAHPLSDAIEGITHSICTLEFENNRELYDWVLVACKTAARPQQLEMARLALGYTIMSKRKLLRLVEGKLVGGWDDPRMPTIAGMRRRGVTPEALRSFADMIGVAKANSLVDIGKLEFAVRDDANQTAPRAMCVLAPLRLILTDYPADKIETLSAPSFPPDVGKPGKRAVPLGRELYIERDDFVNGEPPPGYKRLAPGRMVRLRHAGIIRCDEVVLDPAGAVVELRCSTVAPTDAAKDIGVIHWVARTGAVPVQVRLYDRLFTVERPDDNDEIGVALNPRSLEVIDGALAEPIVGKAKPGARFQFERVGYFAIDPDSRPGAVIANRVVALRDARVKEEPAGPPPAAPATRKKSAKAETRPERASRAEVRDKVRAANPALAARRERYQRELGLGEDEADLLTGELGLAEFFEAALAVCASSGEVAKWIVNEVLRELKDQSIQALRFDGAALGELVAMIEADDITVAAAKEIFALMAERGGSPKQLAAERGLGRADDSAVAAAVDAVLHRSSDEVERYRAGDKKLFGFLLGQVMKQAAGKADPQVARSLLEARLAG